MRFNASVFLFLFIGFATAQVLDLDETWTRNFRRDSGGWTAGDGNFSLLLPDGRRLWTFQDSYTDDVRLSDTTLPCLFQVRNAAMVQDGETFTTLNDLTQSGLNRTFFKETPFVDSTCYWTSGMFLYEDTIYSFAARNYAHKMETIALCVAKITYPGLQMAGITTLMDLDTVHSFFGDAVLFDSATQYYYVYGTHTNFVTREPVVARFAPGKLYEPWEFYTGAAWVSDPTQVGKISDFPMGGTVTVLNHGGGYYLITQENGFLTPGQGRRIYAYSSDLPTGPFTDQRLLYTIEDKWKGQYLVTYNATAHEGIYKDSVLIAYNVNGNDSTCRVDIWTERLNADCYRPKAIAVPYSMLGPDFQTALRLPGRNPVSITVTPVFGSAGLKFDMHSATASSISVRILDLFGRTVMQKPITANAGSTKTSINLESITNGIYMLAIEKDAPRYVRFTKTNHGILLSE